MKKKIGFVLNAPVRYSETFLLKEFELLQGEGYDIEIFEGYNTLNPSHPYQRTLALPNHLTSLREVKHIAFTIFRLITLGFIPMLRFIYYERKSNTGIIRILKRLWFNAHILPSNVQFLHFCFADVAIQKELTAKAIKATMSVSLRGSDVLIYPKINMRCYEKLWSTINKAHAVSHYVLERAKSLGLYSHTRSVVIPDGVDLTKISYNSGDFHSPLRIISVARLEPTKNFVFALEVIKILIDQKIDLHYSIAGEGSEYALIHSRIKDLGLDKQVTLLGALTNQEVLDLMSISDLFIHTSLSEGLGVSLLEAQASGLPVISLDAGGTSESIEDKKSGWIVSEKEPQAMAKIIESVIKLPLKERIQMKNYSKNRIEKLFNIQKNIQAWKTFFGD